MGKIVDATKGVVTDLLWLAGIILFVVGIIGGFVPALGTFLGVNVAALGLFGSVALLALIVIAVGVLEQWVP